MSRIAYAVALSLPLGMLLGIVYDVIRFSRVLLGINVRSPFAVPRGGKRFRAWIAYLLVALGDFFFFCVAAVCMCVFFFLSGDGRMRVQVLVGAFFGFLLYYHTVGRLFIGVCAYCVTALKRIFRFLLAKSILPIRLLWSLFAKLFAQILALPIVRRTASRYNEYRQKRKAERLRRKRQKRGQYCKNG